MYSSYLHVRLRQYAESIAFCDGEIEENKRASKSLDTLLTYQRNIVNKELPLKCKIINADIWNNPLTFNFAL